MTLEIIDNGVNNHIRVDDPAAFQGRIVIGGDGAFLHIAGPLRGGRLEFTLAAGSRVEIGGALLNNGCLRIDAAAGGEVEIGADCTLNGALNIRVPEPARATLGRNCLVSDQVSLNTSDQYALFDRATRQRINPAANITIGPRVWLGQGASVMKGAEIGQGAIIGARAVVTGSVPEFCAAAGNPLRIIREDIAWGMALQAQMPEPPAAAAPERPAPQHPEAGPPAPQPAFRLLRARRPTALQPAMADAADENAALPAAAGAWLMAARLTEAGAFWRVSGAMLDGARLPPHDMLALQTHWELLPL